MKATITINEVDFDVQFDYQPEESETGCAAQFEGVWEIKHKGTDFLTFFKESFEDYEQMIYDAINELWDK